ncbi:MAG: outer membrane protein assembly factor BamE [Bdellovibrionales bacterium]|nr:outer membrane protein assembly factor BamE [Bdellovibrionales bacterium]MBL7672103.1 outer membrane protein assembly factor BamE [Pseudobdellovibrionaceae bacterium]
MALLLSGCQTHLLKEFETIAPGMEKDDVLGKMGSPSTSIRLHNKDRWIYVFYDDKMKFEKEVHFFEGNVVYIGEKWEPPYEKQASVVDAKNQLQDETLRRQAEQENKAQRDSFEEYTQRIRSQDRVRYLPEFTPIR